MRARPTRPRQGIRQKAATPLTALKIASEVEGFILGRMEGVVYVEYEYVERMRNQRESGC